MACSASTYLRAARRMKSSDRPVILQSLPDRAQKAVYGAGHDAGGFGGECTYIDRRRDRGNGEGSDYCGEKNGHLGTPVWLGWLVSDKASYVPSAIYPSAQSGRRVGWMHGPGALGRHGLCLRGTARLPRSPFRPVSPAAPLPPQLSRLTPPPGETLRLRHTYQVGDSEHRRLGE